MNIVDIISKKRDGKVLSTEEIEFWINGIKSEDVADYQSSALLMAIVLQGMNQREINDFTKAMLHSGEVIDLSDVEGKIVDKHSTGGVGDKTSIVLSPLVAACGAKVAKMSGRGLGHTGGTLDKLESIPHYNIYLENEEFIKQVNEINCAVIGQTSNLVYADKVLYALRDVTGTVQSIPLIASSIMSKKLAGGADCIVLDVKYGEGAFMKSIEEAEELARTMIGIGKSMDKEVNALITNMNQPLGRTIGNALEVYEAVQTLQGNGPKDLEELCLIAASMMLQQAGLFDTEELAYEAARTSIEDGSAYAFFKKWISAQNGDIDIFDDLDSFIKSNYVEEVRSHKAGYIHSVHALNLGLVSMHLGAGREKVDDEIDYKAGVHLEYVQGEYVQKGEVLCRLHSSNIIDKELIEVARSCYEIKDAHVDTAKLIENVL